MTYEYCSQHVTLYRNSLTITAAPAVKHVENECYILCCKMASETLALEECQCVSRVLSYSVEFFLFLSFLPSFKTDERMERTKQKIQKFCFALLLRSIMQPYYVERDKFSKYPNWGGVDMRFGGTVGVGIPPFMSQYESSMET